MAVLEDFGPDGVALEVAPVADDEEVIAGARQSNVHASVNINSTNHYRYTQHSTHSFIITMHTNTE